MKTNRHHSTIGQTRQVFCLALALVASPTSAPAAARLIALGDLPGGETHSRAFAISADGTTVVGESGSTASAPMGDYEAFRWTAATGMVGLGDLAGGNFSSQATAVSADGSVITGFSTTGAIFKAFRWTPALGLTALPDPAGVASSYSVGYGVSANGGSIAGYAPDGTYYQAAIWTLSGIPVLLGDLPGGSIASVAQATTPTGSAVAGFGYNAAGKEAMFWSASTKMVGLGYLEPGGTESYATAISADGSVIIGDSKSGAAVTKAFRWTLGSGMTGLGQLPGGSGTEESHANAISADGSTIVGYAYTSSGTALEAFIWDAGHGMRSLKNLLQAQGANVAGWRLGSAVGISADGRRIVGTGRKPNDDITAWMAVFLPNPPTLAVTGALKVRAKPNGKFTLRGTARDDAAVVRVEYQLGGKGVWKPASGTSGWSVVAKLKKTSKKTKIFVRAVDEDGQFSPVLVANITR